MDKRGRVARQLVFAESDTDRQSIFAKNHKIVDDRLAFSIRDVCYEEWSARPQNVKKAEAAIRSLKRISASAVVAATLFWIEAIASIVAGKFEKANTLLADAAASFSSVNLESEAARVRVAQLLSLAMLGRYDDAFSTGKAALRTFIQHSEEISAGKVELNISNLLARQGKNRESLRFCTSASRRFLAAKATSWYAMAENGLANTYTDLNELNKAELHYNNALAAAKREKMEVTVAEIEACIGSVATGRGQYSKALRFLERSRRRYETLGMPHQSAIADLEMAEIYAELNLLDAAEETLARLGDRFRTFKLRAEEARARLLNGRVLTTLGKAREASGELYKSKKLFLRESNIAGQVSALLAMASLEIRENRPSRARKAADEANSLLALSENPRHRIQTLQTEGQIALGLKDVEQAESCLRSALKAASRLSRHDDKRSILFDLGVVSKLANKNSDAKRYLNRSIELAEKLHSGISNDQFGISFLASRLEPFKELAGLLIDERKVTGSFQVLERGRSRSLLNSIGKSKSRRINSVDLETKRDELRAELNQLYKKFDRLTSIESERLVSQVGVLEHELTGIERRLQSLMVDNGGAREFSGIDVLQLRNRLGSSRALVEFIDIAGQIGAYVITLDSVRFYRDLVSTQEVSTLLADLHFQFSTLRYGISGRFAEQIRARTNRTLKAIYDRFFRPLELSSAVESMLIVPAGPLYYVPFCALFDGVRYMVERFEILLAPSAAVWQKLCEKKAKRPKSALLMGLSDESIPMAESEIRSVRTMFAAPASFTGKKASFDNFRQNASAADVIHLACHGQFRPDNPMFSSLKLADGWMTVGDLTLLQLKAELVTLSACDTGQSKIYAGDEVLGLARGFLSAGASTIVASLWAVNDKAAAGLMKSFYAHLTSGVPPSRSLRLVQIEAIEAGLNPYYWSPFFAIGR